METNSDDNEIAEADLFGLIEYGVYGYYFALSGVAPIESDMNTLRFY